MFDPSEAKIFYTQNGNFWCSLSGVNNLSIVNNISFQDRHSLGGICAPFQINAPTQVEVNLEFDLIQSNSFLQYTGEAPICLNVHNGYYSTAINNLYLDSYSIQFTVGDIPKVNTKFISYGQPISTVSIPASIISNPFIIDIPNLKSLAISGSNLNIAPAILDCHNIYSLNYSINSKRCVLYNTNSLIPDVVLIKPLIINAVINSKFIETAILDYKNNVCSAPTVNLCFNVVNRGIYSTGIFPVSNSMLISTETRLTNQNFQEMKREYIGYYGI